MPRSDRFFGVEFEFTTGSRSLTHWANVVRPVLTTFGKDLRVRDGYYASDGSAWELKVDGTAGYELVTPKMTWAEWPEVEAVLSALLRAGARTNASCGLHVHHDVRDYSESDLAQLVRLWAVHEETLFALLPDSRHNNTYCPRLGYFREGQTPQALTSAFHSMTSDLNELPDGRLPSSKYWALNLSPFWASGRVEVRAANGTLRASDAAMWVELTQGLVEQARRAARITASRAARVVQADRTQRLRLLLTAARWNGPSPEFTALRRAVRTILKRRRPTWLPARRQATAPVTP